MNYTSTHPLNSDSTNILNWNKTKIMRLDNPFLLKPCCIIHSAISLIPQNLLVILTMNVNQHFLLITIIDNRTFCSNPYYISETSECFACTIFALQNVLKSMSISSLELVCHDVCKLTL